MMSRNKHDGFLGAVYEAKGHADLAALYDTWSDTYDGEMARIGYRHPTITLSLVARHVPKGAAPVLDAGCGTGLLGEWLGIAGYPHVEGLDLSPGMLAAARKKACYKALHQLALGEKLPFATGNFAAVALTGVFTVGHVGAEGLDELIRCCTVDGKIIFTVKDALWATGFSARVSELIREKWVDLVEETPSYVSMPGDAATTPSHGVVLRVLRN
jgi:predicted TPR repeat methyltransferase